MPVSSLLIGLLLPILPGDTAGQPTEGLLNQAETAFHEAAQLRDQPAEARRLFRQAADCYERVQQLGVRSPALLLNQGHAYEMAGDLPRAIRAYRRGLRLDPNDRALHGSLTHARQQVVYAASVFLGRQPVDHWPPWLPWPTRWPLLGLTAGFYSLGWLCLMRWRMTRHGRLLWLGGLAFGAALLPAGAWSVVEWKDVQESRHPLVVIARDGLRLSKGNGLNYPVSHPEPMNRGVEANQLFVRGDWLQIELAGGEVGWVPRSAVVLNTP